MLSAAFLRTHGRLIAFGVFMCLCSSPGQTFFISLFGGEIRQQFQLSHGDFGSLYSLATLASAASLVWLGRLIDRLPLAAFAMAVLAGLALTCLLMGLVWGPLALLVAFYGLRLFGQGLATHTGIIAMGRYFEAERGRAVGIASLGNSLGEAALPLLVVTTVALFPWQNVWIGTALVLIALTPIVLVLLKGQKERDHALKSRLQANAASDHALRDVLRDLGLWLRMPAILAPSAVFTGLIFHQVHVAASKGWPLSLMAGSFTLFAGVTVVMLLISGWLVDRISARRLVPLFLLPLAVACFFLAGSDERWVVPAFFVFIGINTGLTAVISGSLWPELYGIAHLGAIRAFAQAAMVFSSGLAPAIFGLLIDWGVSIEAIAAGSALFCLAASALAAFARPPKLSTVR